MSGKDPLKQAKESILRLLSGGETLVIDECDGSEILADKKVFTGYVSPDFKSWGLNVGGPATKATPVAVYEMSKDATFAQMFGSLSSDPRRLCLTQAQIKGFVKKHQKWLRTEGYATFFLFELNNEIFVAYVNFGSDGERVVDVDRFEDSAVWNAGHRRRVVVPQLEP